jgi:hypothetical protein
MKKYLHNYLKLLALFLSFNFNTVYAEWIKIDQILETHIYSFFDDGINIYVGGENIIYVSSDRGNNWAPTSVLPDDANPVSAIYKTNNILFAGTFSYGVYISYNNGINWQAFNGGLIGDGSLHIADFERQGDSIYAATIGASIFVANLNNLFNWQAYHSGIPLNLSGNSQSIFRFNDTLIAGAGGNGAVYVKMPGDNFWNERFYSQPGPQPVIMFDFEKIGNVLVGAASTGVYYSLNSGIDWTAIPNEIGYISAASLALHNSELYISLVKGGSVYIYKFNSLNYSLELYEFRSGLQVSKMIIAENKIFEGRFFEGVWYKSLAPTNIDDPNQPTQFHLNQNYPNPFNPNTEISFSLPIESKVTIKVFDILGREASTLVDDILIAGNHSHNLNMKGASSGVYFYSMQVHGMDGTKFTSTKKMILLE